MATSLPAFRVKVGDVIVLDRKRYNVRQVGQVAFFAPRTRELAPSERSGVKMRLVPARAAGGQSRYETFRNTDSVQVVR